jgi:hypothetical protein
MSLCGCISVEPYVKLVNDILPASQDRGNIKVNIEQEKLIQLTDHLAICPRDIANVCKLLVGVIKEAQSANHHGTIIVGLTIFRALTKLATNVGNSYVILPYCKVVVAFMLESSKYEHVVLATEFFIYYSKLFSKEDFSDFVNTACDFCDHPHDDVATWSIGKKSQSTIVSRNIAKCGFIILLRVIELMSLASLEANLEKIAVTVFRHIETENDTIQPNDKEEDEKILFSFSFDINERYTLNSYAWMTLSSLSEAASPSSLAIMVLTCISMCEAAGFDTHRNLLVKSLHHIQLCSFRASLYHLPISHILLFYASHLLLHPSKSSSSSAAKASIMMDSKSDSLEVERKNEYDQWIALYRSHEGGDIIRVHAPQVPSWDKGTQSFLSAGQAFRAIRLIYQLRKNKKQLEDLEPAFDEVVGIVLNVLSLIPSCQDEYLIQGKKASDSVNEWLN